MKRIILFSVLFFLFGCSTLNPDPTPVSSIEANYPSVEFQVRDEIVHGLKVVSVTRGKPLSDIKLRVQTYFSGTLTVDSRNCNISINKEYSNSELVDIDIPGVARTSCTVTITVSPRYPAQKNSAIKVWPFRGHLLIDVTDVDDYWIGFERKLTGRFSSPFSVYLAETSPVLVEFIGCGINETKTIIPEDGYLNYDLKEVLSYNKPRTCVLRAIVKSEEFEYVYLSFLISFYDPSFASLSIPVVKFKEEGIEVRGDDTVSVVSMNNEYDFGTKSHFSFDNKKRNIVRLITVKRTLIGVWDLDEEKFKWMQ